jgi:hypothetical protein
MGTNFYHRTMICECCGRYDEAHICKSMLNFQGYPDNPVPIVSWQDWKRAIQTPKTYVYDEYGVQILTDEFIAQVEATDPVVRRRQYDWVIEHGLQYGITTGEEWLDAEGFSFSSRDFE